MTTKIWPVPEMLHGDTYEVRESPAHNIVCTDLANKVMFVPSEDTGFGKMARLHEMGHVAITPADGIQQATERGIKLEYLNIAEDMRLNLYLQENFALTSSLPEKVLRHRVEGWEMEGNFKTLALMRLACEWLPDSYVFDSAMSNDEYRSKVLTIVFWARDIFQWDGHGFDKTLHVAEELQKLFENGLDDVEDLSPGEFEGVMAQDKTIGKWGEMNIVEEPMPIQTGARRLIRRIKPKEYGSNLMFPTRLDDDDKIFGTIKKVPGGTILIDVSGSMSINPEDIQNILKEAPGATVAVYSGERDAGTLHIIAKKGRMAELLRIDYPQGNIVDGPALNWLTQQNEPRIWLCDGQVTGCRDNSHMNLTLEAKRIVQDNKIVRVDRPRQVVAMLKKKV